MIPPRVERQHEDLADEFAALAGEYQRTPPWRFFRRQQLLAQQLGTLLRFVGARDAALTRAINDGRRCQQGRPR